MVDLSFLLTRNLWIATKDKEIHEMNSGDVLRLTIQTLNKLARDWGITADKILLIADMWSKDYGGYYRSYLIKDFIKYKGSRKYMTEQALEDLKSDPNSTEEDIRAAERELAVNKIKFEAKQIMKDEFKYLGLPYIAYPGYEFDDIATLASFHFYEPNAKPNVIVTKDSDLSYSLCPNCVQFKLPTRGSDPKVITYDEMYATIPESLKNRGVSLYQYFALINSLGFSHNDTAKTIKDSTADTEEVILRILSGDYSDVENVDAFKAQMNSFNLGIFPNLEDVKKIIANDFMTVGKLGSLQDFHEFCKKHSVTGISDKYYLDFIKRFDPKLFCDKW